MDLGHLLIELSSNPSVVPTAASCRTRSQRQERKLFCSRKLIPSDRIERSEKHNMSCLSLHAAAVVLFETASCENTHAQENDNTHVVRDCVCCGKTSHAHLWAMAMCLRDGVQEAVSERFQSGFRHLWACHWSLSNFFCKREK